MFGGPSQNGPNRYAHHRFELRLLSDGGVCLQHLSYASGDLMVDASFMQTLWNVNPVSSGCELVEGELKNFQTDYIKPVLIETRLMSMPCLFLVHWWGVLCLTLIQDI